jgi:hypothetical protein
MSRLLAFVVQRFPLAVFVPAIGLLAAVAWVPGATHSLPALFRSIALMALLVAEFRVWDDLEDRDADRARHPDRVLTNGSATPFWYLAGLLCAMAVIALAATPRALAGLMLLHASMLWAYRRLRPRITDHAWRYAVLPLKYPAFVLLVTLALGGASLAALAAVGVTYLGACVFEIRTGRLNHVEVAQ